MNLNGILRRIKDLTSKPMDFTAIANINLIPVSISKFSQLIFSMDAFDKISALNQCKNNSTILNSFNHCKLENLWSWLNPRATTYIRRTSNTIHSKFSRNLPIYHLILVLLAKKYFFKKCYFVHFNRRSLFYVQLPRETVLKVQVFSKHSVQLNYRDLEEVIIIGGQNDNILNYLQAFMKFGDFSASVVEPDGSFYVIFLSLASAQRAEKALNHESITDEAKIIITFCNELESKYAIEKSNQLRNLSPLSMPDNGFQLQRTTSSPMPVTSSVILKKYVRITLG